MRIAIIQMNMRLGAPEFNYAHAEKLIRRAAEEGQPDTILLPETWNTGFFPREDLKILADGKGEQTIALMSRLARELQVNIVAGSVTVGEKDHILNRSYIFNRQGEIKASYDKAHLFTNMGEDDYYEAGDKICTFELDGIRCGVVICYDIRFSEWIRKITLSQQDTVIQGEIRKTTLSKKDNTIQEEIRKPTLPAIDILFVPAQWPGLRRSHWEILNRARAIENQMYVAACNSCGEAGDTQYGGDSLLIDPNGEILCQGDERECILYGEIDPPAFAEFREKIPVFRDRREEIYR